MPEAFESDPVRPDSRSPLATPDSATPNRAGGGAARPEREYLSQLLHELAANVRREQLETWFRSLDVVRMDAQEIEFSVTSQFVRDWLQRNFFTELQHAARVVDGQGQSDTGTSKRLVLSSRDEDGWDSLRFAGLDAGNGGFAPGGISTGGISTGEIGHGRPGSVRTHADDPNAGNRMPGSAVGSTQSGDASHGRITGDVKPVGRDDTGSGRGPLRSGVEEVLDPIRQKLDESAPAIEDSNAASTNPPAPTPLTAVPSNPGNAANTIPGGANQACRLNPNYTFDRLVVGSCNRLAHASAIAISENPGFAYNPLFVHGSVGLGKTHLLQAICHTIVKRSPDARVIYMSCEDFTNAFIQAIQTKQVEVFRHFYRSADVLVIDDVQFLAHKDKTQDEFFHTFNALYDNQKQIVLSSDRPPVEIPTIEERLVSRFKWGLVAEVEAPCFDTRTAIVQRKAAGRGTELPEDVARFLAERVATNIRELEGAVIKVVGIAAITGQPITLQLAETCMRGLPMRNGQISADDIMDLITSEFAISARELTGKSRTQMVSLPRQVAMYLIREHTENSLEDVGRIFGGRDHTTVLYAVNKIRERLQRDRTFKELVESLSSRLLTRGVR
ncbi:MAG: chromosomal replication initiator protein DnaA [bacterium]|nr:chromosomal replication initiator protein DnaA [bacterium]